MFYQVTRLMQLGNQQLSVELRDFHADLRSISLGIPLHTDNPLAGPAVPNKTIREVNLFPSRIG